MAAKVARQFTQEEITTGLLAVVAWAGNHSAASRELAKQDPPIHITPGTLNSWTRTVHFVEYQLLRDKHAPEIEAQLAHKFRDVAAQCVAVQEKALSAAEKRLDEGERALKEVERITELLKDEDLFAREREELIAERNSWQALHNEVGSEAARTASFAARTGQTAIDKLMTLTNRPQRIVESRDINEILRSLAAKKILVALPNGATPEQP